MNAALQADAASQPQAGVSPDAPADDSATAAEESPPRAVLVVLRHGYSEYNMEQLFTGWADCDLTNRGKEEARFAGSLLREAGVVRLERVYTSFLKRAIKTAWLMLDELELQWVDIENTWRLNERHYGLLQGQQKRACSAEYGVEQVQKWRRGINYPPPPWTPEMRAGAIDRRYAGVPVPETESLADCAARLQPFLEETLFPAMHEAAERAEVEAAVEAAAAREEAGAQARVQADAAADDSRAARDIPAFVVVSSENLIRALVAELEGVPEEAVPLLDIPYATPLLYRFDSQMRPMSSTLAVPPLTCGTYLGDAERIAMVQQSIRDQIRETDACDGDEEAEEEELAPCDALGEDCFEERDDGSLEWKCGEPRSRQNPFDGATGVVRPVVSQSGSRDATEEQVAARRVERSAPDGDAAR